MKDWRSYKFKRIESDGRHFPGYIQKLYLCSKYDVFDNDEHIATVLTDNRKGVAIIRGEIKIKLKSQWGLWGRNNFYLNDVNDKSVATISTWSSGFFFAKKNYSITFEGENNTCFFEVFDKKKRNETGAVFGYDFFANDEHFCRIINFKKRPVLSFQGSRQKLEGTVSCYGKMSMETIVCLLQFIDIHMEIQADFI